MARTPTIGVMIAWLAVAGCSGGGTVRAVDPGPAADGAGDAADVDAGGESVAPDPGTGDFADLDAGPGDATGEAEAAPLCLPNGAGFPVRPPVDDPATLPFLHVDGTALIDDQGTPVALRGVSFGSWLQMETWISGIGLVQGSDLLALAQQKAADLGLAQLLSDAQAQNLVAYLAQTRSVWVLAQEWRAWMLANAPPGQAAAVGAFWDWFDQQPWIFDEQGLWRYLGGRFGAATAADLREAFASHFITEADVAGVASLGLNVIRVPFWYQALETDAPDPVGFRPEGWKHLDDVARWARKHKVWIILDLHGAPGGQNAEEHSGLLDGGHLAEEPRCVERAAYLWQAIASYFASDPHVAAFDLLNEPMSLSTPDAYRSVHQALYDAVRRVDGNHVVMAEDGYLPASVLASPKEMGWTNAMFSVHLYPGADGSADTFVTGIENGLAELESAYGWSTRFACPVLLGEFNAAGGDPWAVGAMDRAVQVANARGVHWAAWTWKFAAADSTWGVWHPTTAAPIDVKDAGADTIRQAFEGLDSSGFEPWAEYAAVLQARAAAPVGALDLGGGSTPAP